MKKRKHLLVVATMYIGMLSAHAQTLVHYWNFNNNANISSLLTPSSTVVGTPAITHLTGGNSVIDVAGGTGQGFDVENLNARNTDPSGTHLRFNDPIGGALVFAIPSTGFDHIVVKFATRRSASGAGRQFWYYTEDGNNYTLLDSFDVSALGPELKTLDLRPIVAAKDNPLLALKVEFAQGTGGLVGNNRFDNFTVEDIAPDQEGKVTAVFLNKKQTTLEEGKEETLWATIMPADATDKKLLWHSADSGIAAVDSNGVVKGIGVGSTFIVVTTNDGGFRDTCEVNVTFPSGLDLLYYWHFNNLNTPVDVRIVQADYALIQFANAKLSYTLTPNASIVNDRDMDRFTPGTLSNVQQSETAGAALRVRNPSINRSLLFDVPTLGVKDIQFAYAVQRSGNGMLSNSVEYSIDGSNFITTGLQNAIQTIDGAELWQEMRYDFTGIAGVDNNPQFKIRILWQDDNALNTSGNNRYDNITLVAKNVNAQVAPTPKTAPISILAHPMQGTLLVQATNGKRVEGVHVIDRTGRVVAESVTAEVGVRNLSEGIYFIVAFVEGMSYTQKWLLTQE